jgi:rhodanese-related sulfurtransferase
MHFPPRAAALVLCALVLPSTLVAAQPYSHARRAEQTEAASPGEQAFQLSLGDGLTQRLLYTAPARPMATLVMLPGGGGNVGVERDGDPRHDDNFVVRTRAQWAALGYAVVIPDTIDRANLRGLRSSPAYAALIGRLVAFAHAQARAPVFLIGTSQGAIAAMNGAAHAAPGSIAGVVLSESVSRMGHSGETVFSADPGAVRVPALVVANRDDQCDVAPPEDAPKIAAAMTGSPDVRVLYVAGGIARSAKACGSLSPHGYYGIEGAVIGLIDSWMRARI